MLYTSRYANPELRNGKYTAVRISIGKPRWKVGYEIAGAIEELMPRGIFGIEDYEVFRREYFAKLDSSGVGLIRARIKPFEDEGKPVVLLCFEDIRKGDWNWCHRRIFADWWKSQTGEDIPELPDSSKFKAGPPPKKKGAVNSSEEAEQLVLLALVPEIRMDCTGIHFGERYYQVDEKGTKTVVEHDLAVGMLDSGKAKKERFMAMSAKCSLVVDAQTREKVMRMKAKYDKAFTAIKK